MTDQSLAGKLAVVTGGTRSIGRAVVERLLARGASVIGTGTKLDGDVPKGCRYARLQLENPQSVESLCRVIEGERPHILVNNAGTSSFATIEDIDLADVERIHEMHVVAPLRLCQAAIPGMKHHRWGRIVNITAISGIWGRPTRTNYGSAKAALDGLTANLAAEMGPHGILANCVAPGFIDTDILKKNYSDAQRKGMADSVPVKRLGTAEDIANMVVFLAGPENGYTTAQNIVVDGGFGRVR
jgi:NAD(P)-dependent dehydrogenase (short-subunit alcohol dehydrogenase family)